jgi:hypothetical protein
MKLITGFIIVLNAVTCFAQQQETTNLELSVDGTKRNDLFRWFGIDTIRFYRLPEDTLAYEIITQQFEEWPIRIARARTGTYRITYNNYGRPVSEQIKLSIQAISPVVLRPDKWRDYPQNTLAKLQDKDTISILFTSQGCFHADASKLTITKEGDQFIARLYQVLKYYEKKKGQINVSYRDGDILKTVTMTDQHIADFLRFENEINSVNGTGCTTTDWYRIQSIYWNMEKTDGTCRWRGFQYLRKSLFGE